MTNQRIGLNEIVVALWACSSFYIMHATRGENASLLFLPLIGGAGWLILLTYKRPVIATISPLLSFGVLWLNIIILVSYLCNAQRYGWVFIAGNIASSLLLFFSLYLITTRMNLDLRKTLIAQSVLINLLLPVVLARSPVAWGRLNPPEQPNYVAMMALLAVIGALGARSVIWAAALSAIPLYSMVAVQSRDSLLATATALTIAAISWIRRSQFNKVFAYLFLAVFWGVAICGALSIAGVPVIESITHVFENLFLLNDKYRGISSGASGRSDLWAAAIDLWRTHPIFGVGFKGNALLMPDGMVTHNAYLAILADIGLAGFTSYLFIISPAIYYLLRPAARHSPEYPQWAMVILTYILYGLFESRAFSFGNSY